MKRTCFNCVHSDVPGTYAPCISCYSHEKWEPEEYKPTQEERITELERRLDELTETLRNV